MTTRLFRLAIAAAMVPAVALTSCSDNDEPAQGDNGGSTTGGKYVFATSVQGTSQTSYVLLTGESLDEGELSTVNNGLTNDGATQWVFYKDYLYALTYNQGNAGTTRSYVLNASGKMEARPTRYNISRFSSYGMYDDYFSR